MCYYTRYPTFAFRKVMISLRKLASDGFLCLVQGFPVVTVEDIGKAGCSERSVPPKYASSAAMTILHLRDFETSCKDSSRLRQSFCVRKVLLR